jgi:hypothetical protein
MAGASVRRLSAGREWPYRRSRHHAGRLVAGDSADPEINLVDPDVYLRSGAPHEQFTWLREHAPVFWVRRWRETWLARRSPMAASASRLT